MADQNFVHLHVHSHYSLLDGLGRVDQIIGKAKELGMPAIALTDHGVMHGAIEFYLEAEKAGIKPIVGQEAYVAPRTRNDKAAGIDTRPYHLVLLAKNLEGYKNLIKLTSIAHLEGYYYKPRLDREVLSRYSQGLIATSACLASETSRRIMDKDFEAAEETIRTYQEIFGKDNYYLELQHHPAIPEQQVVNEHVKEFAKKLGMPLIATNDAHYVNSEDHPTHDILVCIQTGKLVSDKDRMLYTGDFSLKTAEEMAAAFPDVPEALENTLKIADMVDLKIPLGESHLPEFPLPEGETEASLLRKWCEEGLHKRYQEITPEIRDRLNYELDVVIKMGFPGYFLIVADFVRFAKSQGIFVGPGRGSAAGSLMAYVTGITNVDPLKYGLLFERFLDPARVSMPDIDMDFEDTRRKEVIDYVRQKYGDDHVAGIITFGTIMARAAVRDVGRVLGVPYNQVDAIAKVVPPPLQGRHIPLKKSVEEAPELNQIYKTSPEAKQLLDQAVKIEGTIRHASQHACAIVISKEPLNEYVAVQAAQGGDVHQVTQYSMNPIDKIGLLKMDFLGLANLTIMRQAVDIIEAVHGVRVDLDDLPLDDKQTFELFGRGDTTGVFQLECLSGETIVSNTTIKKLYEKQNKQRLESVYLDEGKVHKNKILGVFKSGKKSVYRLVAENDWYIKATGEHRFLTENGWKKLKQLRTGDRILIKTKAKHLIDNHCQQCNQQISGQKDGLSTYCYSCSARHYSNPSKTEARERIRLSRLGFYQRGGKPWNKCLTVQSDQRLAATGRKISRALKGHTLEERYGPLVASQKRELLRARMLGSHNHMFGRRPPHRKGGFRADLGHYVRSNWEADFARVLKYQGHHYKYEPETFPITLADGQQVSYTPDFYVPDNNTYYEIKGWMHDLDRQKLDAFERQYPEKKLEVISSTKFAEFALQYQDIVNWECPVVPRGFDFIAVKEIIEAGQEDTFDIAMEEPGNNFVANGFVVHNSSGMKRYIRELQPNRIEDITAMVALYRPGPMQWIDSFIKRKHGREPIEYLHPLAKDALEETYGIPVYQEQVMRMSKDMCGFTGSEADTLRKAIGKKIPKLMAEMKEKFIKGAVSNGVDGHRAEEIWKQLEDFAAYCFNKSHAACYAMIAYQTAYLKAHYPDCFMAALMTSDLGDIERISIEISECERMGLTVLPPDVNESFADFAVVKDKSSIRFGLGAVKNLGIGVAKQIVAERKTNGPFESLEDFLVRCGAFLNKKVLESLVKSGALDRFGQRTSLYAGIELLVKVAAGTNKQNSSQVGLFDGSDEKETMIPKIELPQLEEDTRQNLVWEKELLGLYLSDHPIKEFVELLGRCATPAAEIALTDAGKTFRIGGIVHELKKITTKSNQTMAFAQIEDATGTIEVVLFPSIYTEHTELWQPDKLVLVQGKVSDKDGQAKILADRVWPLETVNPDELGEISQTPVRNRNYAARAEGDGNGGNQKWAGSNRSNPTNGDKVFMIELPSNATKATMEQLKAVLSAHPGGCPVELRVVTNGTAKSMRAKMTVNASSELREAVNQTINAVGTPSA